MTELFRIAFGALCVGAVFSAVEAGYRREEADKDFAKLGFNSPTLYAGDDAEKNFLFVASRKATSDKNFYLASYDYNKGVSGIEPMKLQASDTSLERHLRMEFGALGMTLRGAMQDNDHVECLASPFGDSTKVFSAEYRPAEGISKLKAF